MHSGVIIAIAKRKKKDKRTSWDLCACFFPFPGFEYANALGLGPAIRRDNVSACPKLQAQNQTPGTHTVVLLFLLGSPVRPILLVFHLGRWKPRTLPLFTACFLACSNGKNSLRSLSSNAFSALINQNYSLLSASARIFRGADRAGLKKVLSTSGLACVSCG